MKIVKSEDIELVSENEFSKVFKYKDSVDMFFSKAFDEDTNTHCVVMSIPSIEEVRVLHLAYPFVFELESDRNSFFENFDLYSAKEFIIELIEHIIKQNKLNEEKQKEIDEKDTNDGNQYTILG